jgi:hypothetical protein
MKNVRVYEVQLPFSLDENGDEGDTSRWLRTLASAKRFAREMARQLIRNGQPFEIERAMVNDYDGRPVLRMKVVECRWNHVDRGTLANLLNGHWKFDGTDTVATVDVPVPAGILAEADRMRKEYR